MPADVFRMFDDGLKPEQRVRHEFITNTNLDDERLWVPYTDGTWLQMCWFNVTTGGFANILKVAPGKILNPHYHVGTVHGLTLRGTWRYLEHDWMATAGTYVYEPAGEAHTLVVPADSKEPMMTFFVVSGGIIYLDSIESGKAVGYDDGFTLLELARKHYRKVGIDLSLADRLIR